MEDQPSKGIPSGGPINRQVNDYLGGFLESTPQNKRNGGIDQTKKQTSELIVMPSSFDCQGQFFQTDIRNVQFKSNTKRDPLEPSKDKGGLAPGPGSYEVSSQNITDPKIMPVSLMAKNSARDTMLLRNAIE